MLRVCERPAWLLAAGQSNTGGGEAQREGLGGQGRGWGFKCEQKLLEGFEQGCGLASFILYRRAPSKGTVTSVQVVVGEPERWPRSGRGEAVKP